MTRDSLVGFTAALSIVIFLIFIWLSKLLALPTYIPDNVIFIIFTLILYFAYNKLRLNIVIFTLLIFGMIVHSVGVFGWYYKSPVGIQWDHIAHFYSWFAVGLLFFNYFSHYFDRKLLSKRTLGMSFCILLAVMGTGTITEMTEFIGFLALGTGEGGLYFGAGDALPGQPLNPSDVDAYGGGWINTMWDLIYNTLGAILAMLVVWVVHYSTRQRIS